MLLQPLRNLLSEITMKYSILTIAALLFTGCTSMQSASLVSTQPLKQMQSIAQLHNAVVTQCQIIGPALKNMNAMSSQLTPQAASFLSQATEYVDPVCGVLARNPSTLVTVEQIQGMIDNGVPALLKFVGSSTLSDSQKTAIDISIVTAETAISFALSNVVSAPSAPPAQ